MYLVIDSQLYKITIQSHNNYYAVTNRPHFRYIHLWHTALLNSIPWLYNSVMVVNHEYLCVYVYVCVHAFNHLYHFWLLAGMFWFGPTITLHWPFIKYRLTTVTLCINFNYTLFEFVHVATVTVCVWIYCSWVRMRLHQNCRKYISFRF